MQPVDEKQFQRKLCSKDTEIDKPEIAVGYARLLIELGRLEDAATVVYHALDEGPRYDLYELRALSTHDNLIALWKNIHEQMGKEPPKSTTAIDNDGIQKDGPDCKEILKKLKGR